MLIMFKETDYKIKVVDNSNFLDVGIIYWDDDIDEFKMAFNLVAGNAEALLDIVDLLNWVTDNPNIIKK